MERTVAGPDAVAPDRHQPDVVLAFRKIPERGNRVLRVVYRLEGDLPRIITAFFDRRKRL
jgi:hypothetical protein